MLQIALNSFSAAKSKAAKHGILESKKSSRIGVKRKGACTCPDISGSWNVSKYLNKTLY